MREAGLRVRLGIDVDADAAKTYQENFPRAKFIRRDIRKLRTIELASHVNDNVIRPPVVFGACAPCQPFSKHRHRQAKQDARKDLLQEFHRFVRSYRPEYVFIENVPGLQSVDDTRGPLAKFLRLLSRLGYWYSHKVISACDYGVPQRRRRLVLIASRLGPISFPSPTHGPVAKKALPTVWEAIRHLPPIKAGQSHSKVANHRAAGLSELNLRRIKATKSGGTRARWPTDLVLDCHENHIGHTDVYGRMAKDLPSAALTTRCISLSNGRFGHPTQHRAISVREAACLQTFPMDFEFFGNMESMSRQVGNAVPVAMAKVFGKAIQSHYRRHKTKASR
jgi:DNA (cytosine-5)-methyltransferase 1